MLMKVCYCPIFLHCFYFRYFNLISNNKNNQLFMTSILLTKLYPNNRNSIHYVFLRNGGNNCDYVNIDEGCSTYPLIESL